MLYKKGRNLLLIASLLNFLSTILLIMTTSFLLAVNLLQHVLAALFFFGLVLIIWGLGIGKEYKKYKLSYWDILLVLVLILFFQDNWYTLVTPHPFFHDSYFI